MNKTQDSGWSRVFAGLRLALQGNVQLMSGVLGPSLRSATLFGEAVTSGILHGHDAVRSVLVVEGVELSSLRSLAQHGPRLAKSGMTAPIVVTSKYVHESLDTFPLEWLEIQQQGVTVLGNDPFSGLVFEPTHVRLQCERELKRVLMGLRQGLLAATGKERAVSFLERDAVDTLIRTLRGVLWLKGRREHLSAAVVMEEIERFTGGRLEGLRAAMNPQSQHDWSEFDRLYADVEMLMGKADAL